MVEPEGGVGGLGTSAATVAVLAISLMSLWRSVYRIRTRSNDVWGVSNVEEVVLGGCVHDNLLFVYRLVVFAFSAIVTAVHYRMKGHKPLRFYTKWNFYLLTLYFGLVVWETYWFKRRTAKNRVHPFGPGSYVAIILYHINMTTIWTVDLGTWTVLYPHACKNAALADMCRQFILNFFSYVEHLANAFLMLGELFMNRMPFFDHLRGQVGIWVVSYVFWSFVYHLHTGMWVYPFANTTKAWSPFVYLATFFAHFCAYRIFHLLHWVKNQTLLRDRVWPETLLKED
ncbi:unnamed protein product [Ostreobium quekettii]|uniref:Uncharacterized protein n=1 Tax=Ostreobium quekettii TaxID=121088 RepID=A0A8S1IMT5_9CHLO|nr:unnamed protein product [Ostreobium quekettii]